MQRRRYTAMILALALVFSSCADDDDRRLVGGSDGGDSSTYGDAGGDGDGDADGEADGDCSESAKYVYVVDSDSSFYRFNPPNKAFELVGKLDCKAGDATPFSMSVARDGTAHVLHDALFNVQKAGIYPVSTQNASCGDKVGFQRGTSGFTTFGMGFVTLNENTISEELFVGNSSQIATLDTNSWSIAVKGPLAGDPEFTGNALGELWGFFPNTQTPKVAQIDKTNGSLIVEWPLPSLSNDPSAWAFAFWGGSFYIFYESFNDDSTNVYKVTDGVMEQYIMNTGKRIVGAGVSTCAPVGPVL